MTDLAGNTALHGAVTPTDAASPVMLAATTQDTGGKKGHIDAVAVTFSEPVSHPRDAGGSYPFLLSSRSVTSVEPANGTSVQVRIAEADAPDTGARPTVRYLAGPGFPVVDSAGNNVADDHAELGGRGPARSDVRDDGGRRRRRPHRPDSASLL